MTWILIIIAGWIAVNAFIFLALYDWRYSKAEEDWELWEQEVTDVQG